MIGESKRWTAKLQADGRQLKALSTYRIIRPEELRKEGRGAY